MTYPNKITLRKEWLIWCLDMLCTIFDTISYFVVTNTAASSHYYSRPPRISRGSEFVRLLFGESYGFLSLLLRIQVYFYCKVV